MKKQRETFVSSNENLCYKVDYFELRNKLFAHLQIPSGRLCGNKSKCPSNDDDCIGKHIQRERERVNEKERERGQSTFLQLNQHPN